MMANVRREREFEIFTLVIVLIFIIFGAYIHSQSTQARNYIFQWIFISMLTATVSIPLFYEYLSKGHLDPFAPIVWANGAFLFLYILPATVRLINDDFSITAEVQPGVTAQTLTEVLFWIWIAATLMVLGYYWKGSQRLASKFPKINDDWNQSRVAIAVFVSSAIGLLGYYMLLSEIGAGPRSHLAKGSNVPAFIAVNLLNISSAILIANVFVSEIQYKNYTFEIRYFWVIFLSATMVLFNTFILYTLGGRGRAFGSFIVLLFLFHYVFKRFGIFSGIGVYVLLQGFSEWLAEIISSIISLSFAHIIDSLLNPFIVVEPRTGHLNNLLVFFAGFPDFINLQLGKTFLSPVNKLLPVSLFPGTDIVYNRAFYPSAVGNFGFPIGLVGDLYLNFWIPGVIVGFLLLGILMRTVYEWSVVQKPTIGTIVLFSILSNSFPYGTQVDAYVTSIIGLIFLPALLFVYYICGGIE